MEIASVTPLLLTFLGYISAGLLVIFGFVLGIMASVWVFKRGISWIKRAAHG